MITNTSLKSLGNYTIEEIDTFSTDQTRNVAMDAQFTPFTNVSRASSAELWSTIMTTWATETRTWAEMASILDNSSLKNLGSYTFDEIGTFTPEQVGGVEFERQFSPLTNTSKHS